MNTTKKQGLLVISRHAESEWNVLGKWTGFTNVGLTDKGKADSVKLGEMLQDITFDHIYTSDLKRTHETLEGILKGKGDVSNTPRTESTELKERDYGDLTGKNKWEVQQEIGDEAFTGIRRGWDYPVPGGETLKDVYDRALPYFKTSILPRLQQGENILMVAHGNSIRALMKYFDQVPEEQMAEVEMPFGQLLLYTFDDTSDLPIAKNMRQADISATHA